VKKLIAIIGPNFYPEDSSTGLYSTQMAECLSENGFDVSVITGFPYYPQWEIWEGYRNKSRCYFEEYKGIKIFRYKQYTPGNPNFKNRIRHILSFTLGNLRNLFQIRESDLIIAVIPFTTDVLLARLLAERTGAKVWIHIQDFEFDAAFQAKVFNNSGIKKQISNLLFFIEEKLLDKADVVSAISYSMLDKAREKTKSELYYFPNWIDENFINPERVKMHRYMQREQEKFKILYSGNIGNKQNWELFVKLTGLFKDRKDVSFIVVGNGAKKDWLLTRVTGFSNVKYYPPVPYKELPDLLCSADLHILFQDMDVVDSVMPSKVLGMMASAKPSLVVGNPKSEVYKIFAKASPGFFVDKEDVNKIGEDIDALIEKPELRISFGKNARNYVVKHFSKNKVLDNFVKKVNNLLKGGFYA